MRTIIYGAGSLGTVMGAVVSKNGGECTLVDANKAHVDFLNEHGATVTGYMDIKNAPVKAITPDQLEGIYDLVIVLLKQTANQAALTKLLPYLDENSTVCTLQNGIPEENVAKIVGAERTIGGSVRWGAGWKEPGVSELYTDPKFMRVEIGSMTGEITENVKKAESFLKYAGEVEVNTNLTGVRWSKLLMNAALSGMSAATGSTFGDVIDDDKAVTLAAHVANELILTARAKGVKMEIIVPGRNFLDLEFHDEKGRENSIAWLRDFYSTDRPQKASMLQDMEKNIPCEIDYINGQLAENGDKYGVDTPVCDTIIKIVKDFEAGKIPFPTMDCLKYFEIPEIK